MCEIQQQPQASSTHSQCTLYLLTTTVVPIHTHTHKAARTYHNPLSHPAQHLAFRYAGPKRGRASPVWMPPLARTHLFGEVHDPDGHHLLHGSAVGLAAQAVHEADPAPRPQHAPRPCGTKPLSGCPSTAAIRLRIRAARRSRRLLRASGGARGRGSRGGAAHVALGHATQCGQGGGGGLHPAHGHQCNGGGGTLGMVRPESNGAGGSKEDNKSRFEC